MQPDGCKRYFDIKRGYSDLIANPENARGDIYITTFKDSYKAPLPSEKFTRGKREMQMEKFLFQEISKKAANDYMQLPPPTDYLISTKESYTPQGYPASEYPPTVKKYPLYRDPAITFWTDHKKVIHGISSRAPSLPVFPKYSEFTKPTEIRLLRDVDEKL